MSGTTSVFFDMPGAIEAVAAEISRLVGVPMARDPAETDRVAFRGRLESIAVAVMANDLAEWDGGYEGLAHFAWEAFYDSAGIDADQRRAAARRLYEALVPKGISCALVDNLETTVTRSSL